MGTQTTNCLYHLIVFVVYSMGLLLRVALRLIIVVASIQLHGKADSEDHYWREEEKKPTAGLLMMPTHAEDLVYYWAAVLPEIGFWLLLLEGCFYFCCSGCCPGYRKSSTPNEDTGLTGEIV